MLSYIAKKIYNNNNNNGREFIVRRHFEQKVYILKKIVYIYIYTN